MGDIIGILSTVILVSTLATLVFAVFAYIASRKRVEMPRPIRHEHPIPEKGAAPALPQEFIMRIRDVRNPPPEQKVAEPQPTAIVPPPSMETEPVPPPLPTAGPVFRSLADKKRMAEERVNQRVSLPEPLSDEPMSERSDSEKQDS